jgi:hypothetical protein
MARGGRYGDIIKTQVTEKHKRGRGREGAARTVIKLLAAE